VPTVLLNGTCLEWAARPFQERNIFQSI
jgi:hypothetical protein